VEVRRRPRVAVLSTGAELVTPGRPLRDGAIYDANAPLLAAAAAADSAEVIRRPPVTDDPAAFIATLDDVASTADVIVTSGGVSAGAYEVVKDALVGSGVEFVKVAMQPGMPQGCGRYRGVPIVTLPGNPVSASVSYELFVAPMIRRLLGHTVLDRPTRRARLATAVPSKPDKTQYRRARIDPESGDVRLVGGPGSHLVAALAHADVLAVIPPGSGELAAGTAVDVIGIGS
jgi:molybdopterin molybdotransferase